MGARQLGLNVLIEHPEQNGELQGIFLIADYLDLQDRLRRATPEKPIVSGTYCLNVKGERRWYKAVARPLWEGNGTEQVGVIGKFVDDHEEQLRLERLKRMAEQDSLTRLNNHAAARRWIQMALSGGDRPYAMVLFDLDNFKEANDRYGHMFGDEVLKHVAQLVQKSVRSGDIAARIGGDEFLIFLEYSGEIEPVIRQIFAALHGEYQSFEILISMGIALSPENGTQYDALFHAADQALYVAKKGGKDRYRFYDDSMQGVLSVLSPMDA